MRFKKTIRLTNYQIELVENYSLIHGMSFNKAVESMIEFFILNQNQGKNNEATGKKLSNIEGQNSKNSEMIFALIEELELLKKMVLLSGCFINKTAEKYLLNEFPNILE